MGFSFPLQVIQINAHITDTFFFNPYGIHIGFSQVITKNVVQEILFANQFLVFGWYAPGSYSLYSKLLFTNESLSLFQLYTDGKCDEEKWTVYPLKNKSTKRVKITYAGDWTDIPKYEIGHYGGLFHSQVVYWFFISPQNTWQWISTQN